LIAASPCSAVLCRAGGSGLVGGTFGLDAGLDGGEKSRGLRQCQTGAKKADKAKRGKKTQTIMDTMWDDLDQQTAEVMIEGAKTLAMNGVEGRWRRCSRRHPGTDRREPVARLLHQSGIRAVSSARPDRSAGVRNDLGTVTRLSCRR
jgi:hypothetical protein